MVCLRSEKILNINTTKETFIREDQRIYFGLKPLFLIIDLVVDLSWLQKFEKEN